MRLLLRNCRVPVMMPCAVSMDCRASAHANGISKTAFCADAGWLASGGTLAQNRGVIQLWWRWQISKQYEEGPEDDWHE